MMNRTKTENSLISTARTKSVESKKAAKVLRVAGAFFFCIIFAFLVLSASAKKGASAANVPAGAAAIPEDIVESLWKAHAAKTDSAADSDTDETLSAFMREYDAALEAKDYCALLRFSTTLNALYGASTVQPASARSALSSALSSVLSTAEIKKHIAEDIPALQTAASAEAEAPGYSNRKKITEYISGTVTVFVDKGLKVENGRGFADAVLGSGFFIDKRGYLITNHHVIESEVDTKYKGYSRLYIRLAEDYDTKIPAKVIGYDKLLDLALLKAEVAPAYVFALGSSSDLESGDKIYAIGSPVGLEKTITSGIVSATDRNLYSVGNFMQIDAAINSGNSGGPIIDENGAVQAIVFAGALQFEGLNFAIPIEYLKNELPYLFSGGAFSHAWMGAYGRTSREGQTKNGVVIQYVMPDGNAQKAGIKKGNVITHVNGAAVTSIEELQNEFLKYQKNTIITISGIQDGDAAFSLPVFLSERPEYPGYAVYERDILSGAFTPIFGMELTPSSELSKKKFVIKNVLRGSIADESGFSENDPIDIVRTKVSKDKDYLEAEIYAKKHKSGYIETGISIAAPLDSPYYF